MVGSTDSASLDRLEQLESFDELKSGIKGLVDAGVTAVPLIFIRPPEELAAESLDCSHETTRFAIPVVDLGDLGVMEEMLAAARGFHEQAVEVKREFYNREMTRKVKYSSNFDLYESKAANWRDTLLCVMGPEPLDPQELPLVCRFRSIEHRLVAKHVGPRVSVACFFTLHLCPTTRLYGPIKELLSKDHPQVYRGTTIKDFIAYYDGKGLDSKSALTHFKLL